jgi:hypothetical protein
LKADELIASAIGLITVSLTQLLTGAAQSLILGFAGAFGGWLFARAIHIIKTKFKKKIK